MKPIALVLTIIIGFSSAAYAALPIRYTDLKVPVVSGDVCEYSKVPVRIPDWAVIESSPEWDSEEHLENAKNTITLCISYSAAGRPHAGQMVYVGFRDGTPYVSIEK